MPMFKVVCYPSVKRYETTVEASSIEEAIEVATQEANNNCEYYADEHEVRKV